MIRRSFSNFFATRQRSRLIKTEKPMAQEETEMATREKAVMKQAEAGVLAFREEGQLLRAYYVFDDERTLIGAIPILSVKGNKELRDDFVALMNEIVGGFVKQQVGLTSR